MIHSGEPRTGIAGEVSYAPFEPRVAFSYLAAAASALPDAEAQARPVYFEKIPSAINLPTQEQPVPAEIAASARSDCAPLSEYQWNGPGRHEPARRALDQTLSFVALLALAPLLAIVALALRLLDGGRVFVHDRRIGRFGREIDLLSFRTRSCNNPQMVRFGRLLKQSGISSLPRLLNVFRGDLTLVGPRPVMESELPRYGLDVIYYLAGRPGLTGEWQSHAAQTAPHVARYLQERAYARTRTFGSDLKFLLRILPASLAGKNIT